MVYRNLGEGVYFMEETTVPSPFQLVRIISNHKGDKSGSTLFLSHQEYISLPRSLIFVLSLPMFVTERIWGLCFYKHGIIALRSGAMVSFFLWGIFALNGKQGKNKGMKQEKELSPYGDEVEGPSREFRHHWVISMFLCQTCPPMFTTGEIIHICVCTCVCVRKREKRYE